VEFHENDIGFHEVSYKRFGYQADEVNESISYELPRGKPRSINQQMLSILPQQAAGN
jgi:hypothetical protein